MDKETSKLLSLYTTLGKIPDTYNNALIQYFNLIIDRYKSMLETVQNYEHIREIQAIIKTYRSLIIVLEEKFSSRIKDLQSELQDNSQKESPEKNWRLLWQMRQKEKTRP